MTIDAAVLAIRIQTQGSDQAIKALEGIDRVGSRTAASFEHVGKKAAGVAQAIAAAGEVGTSSMERLVRGATDIAFAFGPEGALVAAAGAAALAIVGVFDRSKKAMDETTKNFNDNLAKVIDAGDRAGLMQQAATLFRGTPSKGFADAVAPKEAELKELQNRIDEAIRQRNAFVIAGLKKRQSELLNDPAVKAYRAAVAAIMNPQLPFQPVGVQTVTVEGKAAKTAEQLDAALSTRISLLSKGLVFDDLRAKITAQLTALETSLTARVKDGTSSLDDRARAAANLAAIEEALAARRAPSSRPKSAGDMVGTTSTGDTAASDFESAYGGPMALVKQRSHELVDAALEQLKELGKAHDAIRAAIQETFGEAITEGLVSAFSGKGITGAFKTFGKSMLAGLGEIFIDMGKHMIAGAAIIQGFLDALTDLIPGGMFVKGAALIALGAGMVALSNRGGAGSGAGGGGGYGGGYNAQAEQVTTIRLMPGWAHDGAGVTPANQINVNQTIIGVNDPKAQSEIMQMVKKAARRSSSSNPFA